ncbi:MAG: hypothetical protein ACYTF1_04605 [Planctomycetota bacterium]|jgi:hypothetical protein
MTAEQNPKNGRQKGQNAAGIKKLPDQQTPQMHASQGKIGPLSDEERMLVRLRDELYEGSWDQFVHDLKARLSGEPHIFEIGPASDRLKETIDNHLRMIGRLKALEKQLGISLQDR